VPARPDAAVIVQARSSSSRLPGKVLMPFGDSTLLAHVLRRLRPAGLPIWLATSTEQADEPVAAIGDAEADGVHRGPRDDVLQRFVGCLDAMPSPPELVVRICADRPFISPVVVRRLVDSYDDAERPDYLANNIPKSYPDGLDVEVVRADALREAASEAVEPEEREHVTPFVYRRPDRYRLANIPCPYGNFSGVRAVIDTRADYDALKVVHERLGDRDLEALLTLAILEPSLFP
jgi:spore coat polysaccharide biosynthesis protein SpsF